MAHVAQIKIPATYMRGGTSKRVGRDSCKTQQKRP